MRLPGQRRLDRCGSSKLGLDLRSHVEICVPDFVDDGIHHKDAGPNVEAAFSVRLITTHRGIEAASFCASFHVRNSLLIAFC